METSDPRRRTFAVVVLVVVLITASVGIYWVTATDRGGNSPGSKSDGPTFYQALAEVNSSVAAETGGPWSLFSVYGIAAQAPFGAGVVGYPMMNVTANACQAQFNGTTLWNGTIPQFSGNFQTGTAPFWQFAYFSNITQKILLATSVLNIPHVYAPMPYPSTCQPWYDFSESPTAWTSLLSPLPSDSSFAAMSVWSAMALQGVHLSSPSVEIMTLGPGIFDGFGDGGGSFGVIFDRCGLAGIAGGAEPLVLAAVNSSSEEAEVSNETHNCAIQSTGFGDLDGLYSLVFESPSVIAGSTTTQVTVAFQVALAYPNGTLTHDFDASGLADWMVSGNLSLNEGQVQHAVGPSCPGWVPTVAECTTNGSGWYAVILSASGAWMGAFGANSTGLGWTVPVFPVVSHQQLVVVIPSSWDVSQLRLNLSSTVPTSTVVGSVGL